MHCSLCLFHISWLGKVFSGCFRQTFLIWETKKVVTGCIRQVVVLYSNNFMEICLADLGLVVLQRWLFGQV